MKRLVGLLILAIAMPVAGQAQPRPLVVAKEPLECLVRQIDKIKLGKKPKVRVLVEDCNIKPVDGQSVRPPNGYLREVPVESVLELDAAKIACIKRNRNRIGIFATRIGNHYLIDLKTCRAPAILQ